MKIFVYKALFIGFMIFVVFYGTFGYVIKSYESKIQNSLNKDKLNFLKDYKNQIYSRIYLESHFFGKTHIQRIRYVLNDMMRTKKILI